MNLNDINAAIAAATPLDNNLIREDVKRWNHQVKNVGSTRSMETRLKMSLSAKGKPKSAEHRQKLSDAKIGVSLGEKSEETKARMRESWKLRKPRETFACVHCGVEVVKSNLNRWHNDNCKQKPKGDVDAKT